MNKEISFEGLSRNVIDQGVPNLRGLGNKLVTKGTTQLHIPGTRSITYDGKVFKYGGYKGTVKAGYGAFNITPAVNIAANLPIAAAVGDTTVTVTVGATSGYAANGAVAANELAGGYLVFGHDELDLVQTRTILANTAVAAGGGTSVLTLDIPVSGIITTSGYTEVHFNPYRYLGAPGGDVYNAVMGVPTVAGATGYFGWIQTWGPCHVVAGGADTVPGNSAGDRTVYFVGDGSVNGGTALTVESGWQSAGFIIDSTASGTGAGPLVMLQISI
jgi:hypothetical protein